MFKEFSLGCLVVVSSLISKKEKLAEMVTRHSVSLVVTRCATRCTIRCHSLHSLYHSLSLDVPPVSLFMDYGRKSWTLGPGRWTLKTLEVRLWTLGIGCWIMDVKTLRSLVNPFQANVLFLFNHLKISKTRGFQRLSGDMESELQLEMN